MSGLVKHRLYGGIEDLQVCLDTAKVLATEFKRRAPMLDPSTLCPPSEFEDRLRIMEESEKPIDPNQYLPRD
jgi:hypothetical protein